MPAAPASEDRIDPRRLVAFLAMLCGMFMAYLDIHIVSASLREIQAGLAASADEIPWVQTAYLIAEIIMIPLSGYLSRALGTRLLFSISAAGFTVASFMCGMASNMGEMIAWRAVQGFIGGGMIPTVFSTGYAIFPRARLPVITALVGLVATLAPTLGPTIGGCVTDALSWQWLFFINVIPGVCVTGASLLLIDFDAPEFTLFNRFDWIGLLTMAGFLGSLEYLLEEGPRHGWLDDETIVFFAWICVISAAAFFARALTAEQPIIDLRSYANRNFAVGSLLSFVLGIGLYGLTLLYPLYLGALRGYDALTIGHTMFVTGVAMFVTAPVAGRLVGKIDLRLMALFGFLVFACGTCWMRFVTKDWDFWELLWPQIFRGVGVMLAIVPLNRMALGTLTPDRLKNASGLYSVMCNLGGAVGLAAIYTFLNGRTDLHVARLHETLNSASHPAADALRVLASQFQGQADVKRMALKQLFMIAHREASVMAFADVFLALTVLFAAVGLGAMLTRRPSPGYVPAPNAARNADGRSWPTVAARKSANPAVVERANNSVNAGCAYSPEGGRAQFRVARGA